MAYCTGKGEAGSVYFHSPESELGKVVGELMSGRSTNAVLQIKFEKLKSIPNSLSGCSSYLNPLFYKKVYRDAA